LRQLKLIGIGAGNPDDMTLQAINALQQVDVVFASDKGAERGELLRARQAICERHMQSKPYRVVVMQDPARERAATDYVTSVTAWHEQRTLQYEQVLREELREDGCGAFLVWGDPSLYDSTLRIVEQLAARGGVEFEYEVIPGISSIQALAARHKISLNQIGQSVHITTGRRLKEEGLVAGTNIVVMLDGECAFNSLDAEQFDIYWGAYLGTADEVLIRGKLSEVGAEIEAVRSRERQRNGWIMDVYLLCKRGAVS
jgi:precorrin-6A synthase